MAASGVRGVKLPPDCGPAKAAQVSRAIAAVTDLPRTPIVKDESSDRAPSKRVKPNPSEGQTEDSGSRSSNIIINAEQPTESSAKPAATTGASTTTGKTEKRLPHHVIERRYRENLNSQIECLRAAVSTTASACQPPDMEDIGMLSNASGGGGSSSSSSSNPNPGFRPLSKAGVIAHAAEYMRYITTQNEEVERANRELRVTVEALRRLVNCEDCGVVQSIINAGT
ncbi:hypothetical protein MBLNU459_g6847t1 [Dothideomycetes sp. NU459]